MSRLHLTDHPDAFAAFRQACIDRRRQDALTLLVSGGNFNPARYEYANSCPSMSEIPSSGGYFLLPSDLDDPVFDEFKRWIRTSNPHPPPLPHFDALRVTF